MTSTEVFNAISKSNSEQCYAIVYLVNNYRIEEAVDLILERFDCSRDAAEETAYMIKAKLRK
ncbi:MAG: hypothetical protein NC517_05350 [Firmicutes bacterium]|nr:hypothetical protein [Bacillota bacterium]